MAEPIEVAIVGMAAMFPGAPDLATYWSNMLAGVDAITDVPASRWDPSYYDPEAAATRRGDRLYCRRGGFVQAATFDPTQFGIMPLAVSGTEPDQLLALHAASASVSAAGCSASNWSGSVPETARGRLPNWVGWKVAAWTYPPRRGCTRCPRRVAAALWAQYVGC